MTNKNVDNRTFFHQVIQITRLVRLPNCLALGLLFIACQEHYFDSVLTVHKIARATTWVFLAAFAYAYNDLRDIEVDKINRPHRPLPSGFLTVYQARQILIGIAILILALVLFAWHEDALWPAGAVAGSVFYSRIIRSKSAFLSNLVASLLVAAVPLSSLPITHSLSVWQLSLGVGLLIFARELQKDALDAVGDITQRPAPLLVGPHRRLFQFVYPGLLILSAVLLFQATNSASKSTIGLGLSLLLVVGLLVAAVAAIGTNRRYRFQSLITKAASYLVVLVLAIQNL